MPKFWKQRVAWFGVALVMYWITLFGLTHMPMPHGPPHQYGDKIAHFVAYWGLTLLLAAVVVSWRGFSFGVLALVWLIAGAYGIFDELTQPLVGRTCDIQDWIADICGALTGVFVAAVLWPAYRSWRDRRELTRGNT